MGLESTSGTWWPRLSAIAFMGALSMAAPRAGAQISFSNLATEAGIAAKCASHGGSRGDENGDGSANPPVKWPSSRLDTYNNVAAEPVDVATEPAGLPQTDY
jgi:hypothetical protein